MKDTPLLNQINVTLFPFIYEYLVSKSSGMPSTKEVTNNATIAMPESVIDLNKKRF